MSDVVIYHPGTQGQVAVPEEAVPHYRASGWLLLSEHQSNEDARAQRETAEAKPSKPKGDQ